MQQGSVGGCDGDSVSSSPSSKNFIANDRNSSDADGRVKVKVEAAESTEAFEVKREPEDECHPPQEYQYDRKPIVSAKIDGSFEIPGHCQVQHQPYRPMTGGLPNSYAFPHFYGPPTMLPPSFSNARPSPDRSMGKIEEHDHDQERYRVSSVAGDGAFFHHEPHRFETSDYHHGKPAGYPGMPYGSFRPSMHHRSAYGGHQNNCAYRAIPPYKYRNRKWSGALRGMHPSMPMPKWFFRPDLPLGTPLPTSHVSNASTVPTSSSLSSRTLADLPETSDFLDSSKIHGQTPTISTSIRCTINGCTCDSFTPGKRHIRYCEKCHHGWVPHDDSHGFKNPRKRLSKIFRASGSEGSRAHG
ncbi:uncharacterized protein LOC143177372 [Calliopsis andreniformis]|uniref:uncharacterized protein LOC143177372 n=1 Tax=Calliopsis andreniformis TaxID=337506 RepID=UPI003FCD7103